MDLANNVDVAHSKKLPEHFGSPSDCPREAPTFIRGSGRRSSKLGPGHLVVGPILLARDTDLGPGEPNGGLTGTAYAALQLAHLLQEKMRDTQVHFVSVGGQLLSPRELSTEAIPDLGAFQADDGIVICPTETMGRLFREQVGDAKLVAICQHPRDQQLKRARKALRPCLEVHVSRYTFWQNFSALSLSTYVPNPLFSAPAGSATKVRKVNRRSPIIGYVGSLVPERGFLHVARYWREIQASVPHARLEVIGGSSLYGEEEGDPEIPTSIAYAEKIRRAFGKKDGHNLPDVSFLGRIDEEKAQFMNDWDFAFGNPTGMTESFCYSVRESLALGIPTFFGAHEGLSEIGSRFPELGLSKPAELPSKIQVLWDSKELHAQIVARITASTRADQIDFERRIDRFALLFTFIQSERKIKLLFRSISNWPVLSRSGIRELWWQWISSRAQYVKSLADKSFRFTQAFRRKASGASLELGRRS